MSAMEAALGGSICLNNAGEALGWLNPNAISILFYSFIPIAAKRRVTVRHVEIIVVIM